MTILFNWSPQRVENSVISKKLYRTIWSRSWFVFVRYRVSRVSSSRLPVTKILLNLSPQCVENNVTSKKLYCTIWSRSRFVFVRYRVQTLNYDARTRKVIRHSWSSFWKKKTQTQLQPTSSMPLGFSAFTEHQKCHQKFRLSNTTPARAKW